MTYDKKALQEKMERLVEVGKRDKSAGWLLQELNEAVILILSALIEGEKE